MARMYITLYEFKLYQGIAEDETGDDELIIGLIEKATQRIEDHTGRSFEAVTDTFYYDSDAVDGFDLWLGDKDLLTVTTLTNGDSSSTTISSANYFLLPRNATPYHTIRIKTDSGVYWQFDTDYWVSVAGTWGYTSTPDETIKQATSRLAAWYYHQKDAKEFGSTAFPEIGMVTTSVGLPVDVKQMLQPYVRIVP